MKDIKEKVKTLLIKHPELRDDDFKLIATLYSVQSGGWNALKNISAFDFLINFANHKYTSFESITRVRRKLQEEDENLRGAKYLERQLLEKKVRKEIKTL
jgi:hypothetical protein